MSLNEIFLKLKTNRTYSAPKKRHYNPCVTKFTALAETSIKPKFNINNEGFLEVRNILQLYFLPARITWARRTTIFIFCEPAVCLVSVQLVATTTTFCVANKRSHIDLWRWKLPYLLFAVNLCRFKIIYEPIPAFKKSPSMASIYLPPIARKKKVDGCPR